MKQQVDRIWSESFHTTLANTLEAQLRHHALAGVRAALEPALLAELLAYRQTCPQTAGTVPLACAFHRAGTYPRRVLTSHGCIPDLRIPKRRTGNRERPWQILTRYQLAMPGLLDQARYHILHYEAVAGEDTDAWTTVLAALKRRGLDPEAVRMVVSDGSSGLPAALATELPTAQQQRCVVHIIRGLERACCYRDLPMTDPISQEALTHEAAGRRRRQQLRTDAHASFAAATRAEAEARLALVRTTWGALEPEVVRLLTKDVDACLTFYQCDQILPPLIRSTNLLERFFREFRTKADEIGTFPNELSYLVVFHLIVIRDDAKHDRGQTAKTG